VGWQRIREQGIDKLEAMIQGGMDNQQSFRNKEYVDLYTTVYQVTPTPKLASPVVFIHLLAFDS
jgi:hypothetical protein